MTSGSHGAKEQEQPELELTWQDISTNDRMTFTSVAQMESFLRWKSGQLEEQLETLRLALQAIADEGEYMYAGIWHREAVLIAGIALQEVSGPASSPFEQAAVEDGDPGFGRRRVSDPTSRLLEDRAEQLAAARNIPIEQARAEITSAVSAPASSRCTCTRDGEGFVEKRGCPEHDPASVLTGDDSSPQPTEET